MSFSAITPDALMPDIVVELNILVDFAKRAVDASSLAEVTEDICLHYRALAICLLARDGDADGFFHWLLHSPISRKLSLEGIQAHGVSNAKYARVSFVDPVLDAVAARQWKLASEIGDLASSGWLEGSEYEDDFCYADFIRRTANQSDDGIDDLLARWRGVLHGAHDHRLDVAEALRVRGAEQFESSLMDLLASTEANARKMADPRTRSPLALELPFHPNRWVSVEGLALLALAERRGIAVETEFEGCPRSARAGRYAPFRPLGYPDRDID